MRTVSLWLALLASFAFAQPLDYSTGGNLKTRQYQTYAAMTLYVDAALGSNTNACTSSGAGACATFNAAMTRVPMNIRHLVTVNVATGTYAEVFRIQGFNITGPNGSVASTAGLSIVGVETAFTVATGSNTGTVSTYVAPTGGAHALLNDTTQTWTVDNLKGRFVTITSGSGVGEYHLITSNTATQLSLAGSFTAAPTGASVYAIQTPGPVFTGAGFNLSGNSGMGAGTTAATAAIRVADVSLQITGPGLTFGGGESASLVTNRVRIVGTTVGVSNSALGSSVGQWTMNQVFVQAGNNSGITLGNNTTALELFVTCSGTCNFPGVTSSANTTASFQGTVSGNFSPLVQSNGTVSLSFVWLDCGTGSTAVSVLAPTDIAVFSAPGVTGSNGPMISNCTNGFVLGTTGTSFIDSIGVRFNVVTNAIVLTNGARAWIEPGINFSTTVNQLSIDGTVFTDADLTTFTRITGPQGSYATRP